jgi:hypothetical protein
MMNKTPVSKENGPGAGLRTGNGRSLPAGGLRRMTAQRTRLFRSAPPYLSQGGEQYGLSLAAFSEFFLDGAQKYGQLYGTSI